MGAGCVNKYRGQESTRHLQATCRALSGRFGFRSESTDPCVQARSEDGS